MQIAYQYHVFVIMPSSGPNAVYLNDLRSITKFDKTKCDADDKTLQWVHDGYPYSDG